MGMRCLHRLGRRGERLVAGGGWRRTTSCLRRPPDGANASTPCGLEGEARPDEPRSESPPTLAAVREAAHAANIAVLTSPQGGGPKGAMAHRPRPKRRSKEVEEEECGEMIFPTPTGTSGRCPWQGDTAKVPRGRGGNHFPHIPSLYPAQNGSRPSARSRWGVPRSGWSVGDAHRLGALSTASFWRIAETWAFTVLETASCRRSCC